MQTILTCHLPPVSYKGLWVVLYLVFDNTDFTYSQLHLFAWICYMCYNKLKQKEKSVRIMADRRASKVLFGFDFQINAAIVLMLENINDLESLRLESDLEDIDLTLSNGQHILAQAKAVVNGSTDFQNVRRNLQKALTSLSEACQSADAKQLILITNSLNPFKDEASRQLIWGPTRRNFSTLPPSAQTIITE